MIPKSAIELHTTKGFDNRYFENLKKYETQIEAYEATENEYVKYFGKTRYRSFDSYRQVRNRRIRQSN